MIGYQLQKYINLNHCAKLINIFLLLNVQSTFQLESYFVSTFKIFPGIFHAQLLKQQIL